GSPYRYSFQNWGDGGAASHTFTATSAGSAIASNWQLKYLVSTYAGDPLDFYTSMNGHISVSPASSECGNPQPTDCYYPAGTKLTWTPSGVSPFVFTEWSGDLTGTTTPGALTVNDQVYVTGNFAQPGRLVRSGVVDAANYQGQGVSPGEIVAIFGLQFGPPAQLAGLQVAANTVTNNLAQTRVLFDGQPAPLVYVSGNQISAIVPYAVAGKTTTRVAIEYQGKAGNAVNLPVLASHPALFTLDSSGSGQVAALNQNNSVNGASNPAVRGSVIQLFGTGEGATTPAGSDGRIITDAAHKPVLPVKVTIAGRDAQVMYFGEAPNLVSGVFQANAVIPADCPQGLVPVSVTVGNAASPAFARVAVQ
ncbi:MAG: hypothetical protein M3Z85_01805, partial [Acidobacteriota bacterium]|nr:hypothetical protein [Acidobacteriota bacterium]